MGFGLKGKVLARAASSAASLQFPQIGNAKYLGLDTF